MIQNNIYTHEPFGSTFNLTSQNDPKGEAIAFFYESTHEANSDSAQCSHIDVKRINDAAHAAGFMTTWDVASKLVHNPDYLFQSAIVTILVSERKSNDGEISFYSGERFDKIFRRINGENILITLKDLRFINRIRDYLSKVNTQLKPKFPDATDLTQADLSQDFSSNDREKVDLFYKWTNRFFDGELPTTEEIRETAHFAGFFTSEDVSEYLGFYNDPKVIDLINRFLRPDRESKAGGIRFFYGQDRIDNIAL